MTPVARSSFSGRCRVGRHRGSPAGIGPRADVSYDAAINGGVIVAFQGSFYLFGGTSSGSPQWAGITADVAQLKKGSLGFLNPALYRIARSTPSAFHDITVG